MILKSFIKWIETKIFNSKLIYSCESLKYDFSIRKNKLGKFEVYYVYNISGKYSYSLRYYGESLSEFQKIKNQFIAMKVAEEI